MVTCSRILISKFQFQNFGSLMHMGLVISSVQNFKLIWLWTICYKLFQVSCSSCNMNDGLLLSILVFTSNCDVCVLKKNIKKNVFFLCVAYDQYPNMFWTLFIYIYIYKKIFEVLKNVLSYGFLKHKKKFLVFLDFTTCL